MKTKKRITIIAAVAVMLILGSTTAFALTNYFHFHATGECYYNEQTYKPFAECWCTTYVSSVPPHVSGVWEDEYENTGTIYGAIDSTVSDIVYVGNYIYYTGTWDVDNCTLEGTWYGTFDRSGNGDDDDVDGGWKASTLCDGDF